MSKKRATATCATRSGGGDSRPTELAMDLPVSIESQEGLANYGRATDVLHRLRDILSYALLAEAKQRKPRASRVEWMQAQIERITTLIEEIRPEHSDDVAKIIETFGPMVDARFSRLT